MPVQISSYTCLYNALFPHHVIVSAVCVQLVSDPWDEELIVSLLSNLQPPLSSHPNLTVWSCRLPSITPKMTVQIGMSC